MSGNNFFDSLMWKNIMKYIYGLGAAVVIVGALFKILHLPGADLMLIVGLLTEAGIFCVSVLEPIHEDLDWTLVYPELALGQGDDDLHSLTEGSVDPDESVVEQLDNMLADARIEPELIASLGKGMRNLSENAGKLNDITSASDATEEYVDSLKGASEKAGQLGGAYERASSSLSEKSEALGNAYERASSAIVDKSEVLGNAYEKAAESIASITDANTEDNNFREQLSKVSGNLSALNNVYEMQIKGASEQLESSQQMYSGINELMSNLHDSIDDTKKYKQSMAELTANLSSLNNVYGNMLSAMNVNK
jgi:chromosome segregation ATPase